MFEEDFLDLNPVLLSLFSFLVDFPFLSLRFEIFFLSTAKHVKTFGASKINDEEENRG